jgi:chaperonin GroES
MKIKPLFDRILIEEFEAKQVSNGIFIPSSAQEKPQIAKVVSVGEGGFVDGKEVKIYVKPGDKILYSKFAGMEYKFGEKVYTIIRQGDILGVIEE